MEQKNHADSHEVGQCASKMHNLGAIDQKKPENDLEKHQNGTQTTQEIRGLKMASLRKHLTYRTKMRTKQRKSDMLLALEKNVGNVSRACAMVGTSRDTHYRWLRADLNYKFEVWIVNQTGLDMAESALFKALDVGNLKAAMHFLQIRGKERDYG